MTSEDIRNVTFEQVRRGYRVEDVDDFLMQVANEIDMLAAERNDAIAAKNDAENKMYILAEKVEEYRGQEETLKTALINAQRMGEQVVHEAKQKAEQMVREATGQTELLRQQAEQETAREQATLENLMTEVTRFRTNILSLYKQHIESMSAVDPLVQRAEDVLQTGGRHKFEAPENEPEPVRPDAAAADAEAAVEADTEIAAAQPEATQTIPAQGVGSLFEGAPLDDE